MTRFLRDIEIFDLLGLSLDDKKKDEYMAKMFLPTLTQAIKRGIEESNLSEDKLDYILEMIDNKTDVEILQVESLKLMPNLLNIIEEEAYMFKKGALLDQLNDIEKDIGDRKADDTSYFLNVISDLRKHLQDEDEEGLKNSWTLYNDQRKKFIKVD
ncbi:MAG: hypothetical protein ABIM99_02825 [Candidatus Dojkabacteria bacterium]